MARRQAGALLADAVAPIAMAVRGGPLANDLRRYKSDRAADAPEAAARLRELLAVFLRDHGAALWREAGMDAGPYAVAVVPSGQGRPGAHPLAGIAASCLDLPFVQLSIAGQVMHVRGVDTDWLRVRGSVAGADVLVLDDTWVSGGSAQSAAAALKLAGARRVAIIVLGRHLKPAGENSRNGCPPAA
jgi:phosphoribosylpyrophosphate synthetase